ncbi:hypothetical protein BKA56DRAFT_623391 [Ilyonectria sp. MPI-CAGE-AT-0026]|nr:hypothetical protein BKA56DRAFT_623391 [Ilyonectria sp. MPI-CAGE-AT-0026]
MRFRPDQVTIRATQERERNSQNLLDLGNPIQLREDTGLYLHVETPEINESAFGSLVCSTIMTHSSSSTSESSGLSHSDGFEESDIAWGAGTLPRDGTRRSGLWYTRKVASPGCIRQRLWTLGCAGAAYRGEHVHYAYEPRLEPNVGETPLDNDGTVSGPVKVLVDHDQPENGCLLTQSWSISVQGITVETHKELRGPLDKL